MEVTKRLRMRFRDSNGALVSFSINPPKEPVNLNDVNDLMNKIISTNTFYTYTGGAVVEKVDALLETTAAEIIFEPGQMD